MTADKKRLVVWGLQGLVFIAALFWCWARWRRWWSVIIAFFITIPIDWLIYAALGPDDIQTGDI